LRIFPGENFPWGGKFSVEGGENFMRNFIPEKFSRIIIQNRVYLSCFFFAKSALNVEMLKVIVRGQFSSRLSCLEDFSWEFLPVEEETGFPGLSKRR